ncbi:glycosyltransferase [Gracilimonas tropica]|uniref:glycosyltransferase n=1 Tax=Gracilimonas tropica TaxID=454600 RepID=UPI000368F1FA|nr:glycosyltransferase [Gracilimonas tropica]
MTTSKIDISVVIVNYKVKEYIANLLNSLERSSDGLSLEIFVVDNASGDNSVSYLKKRFPNVHYIQNDENIGFGKANNQAISQAKGQYTLIINPDTLVSEDTLTTLFDHMEKHEECGACGCKILNPDGTFAPESRRSVPTIWSAACKVFGLNSLFPKSKLFGKYYLSWLGEDEPSKVPVLSGSFMFWRTEVLQKLGGFDERFFMYGEDIDLCYRIQKTGYHIDYVPDTSIIHYKGESTKKGDLKYIRLFNKALYQFFDKQYSSRYSFLFKVLIYIAILLRTLFSFIGSRVKQAGTVIMDLLLLNIALLLGFAIRFNFDMTVILQPDNLNFLWINLLFSGLYFVAAGIFGLYKRNLNSISAHLKAVFVAYSALILITFFARELAFSRLIFAVSFVIGLVLTLVYRVAKLNSRNSGEAPRGKIRSSRVLIVGNIDQTQNITNKIHSRPDWSYEVVGYVSPTGQKTDSVSYLGELAQLKDLVRAYSIDQVFFALNSISYKQMLKEISNLQKQDVIFKLIPDSMDFILGKSNVEYLEAIPLVEVEFDYSKPYNRFIKRVLDIGISMPLTILIGVFVFPSLVFAKKEWVWVENIKLYKGIKEHAWKNRFRILLYVLTGKLSLVGAPLHKAVMDHNDPVKKGITGLVQISEHRIAHPDDEESFELYYLQNYSLWMDLDILIKMIFNGPYPLDQIASLKVNQEQD